MIDRTVTGGRVSQRAGLGPRKRNELLEVLGRKLWMNNENERSDGKRCDRLKILDRIEGNLGIEAGIDRLRARIGHKRRIPARRGLCSASPHWVGAAYIRQAGISRQRPSRPPLRHRRDSR